MTKRRRVRSPHPGVKLKKRTRKSGATSWRAHYIDPDTGREVAKTLSPTLSTKEARTIFAKNLAKGVEKRRMERASGVRLITPTKLEDAIQSYLDAETGIRAPKTLEGHRLALKQLRGWAAQDSIKTTADIRPDRLPGLKDFVTQAPKLLVAQGARQGARKGSTALRSPVTVNRELRSLKALLNNWRRRRLVPLTADDITESLKALSEPRKAPTYYSPEVLNQILEAALRHDADCFTATRNELRGGGLPGGTFKYEPVAPFAAFMMLTGTRVACALALEWDDVLLNALDESGNRVGQIDVPAEKTKTRMDRTVGLEVSPQLRRLLIGLKLRSGGQGRIFEGLTKDGITKARRRLTNLYGAPMFTWKHMRSTCATYLASAPSIFGAASVFRSAAQMGHSVSIAEKHYLRAVRGIARDARTLEVAMQVQDVLHGVIVSVEVASAQAG